MIFLRFRVFLASGMSFGDSGSSGSGEMTLEIPDPVRRKPVVHGGIVDIQGALFNPEEELGFVGIVDSLGRPDRDAAVII